MNKLNKIGLSALCGSLASISAASAGTLDVTGSAHATYNSRGGEVSGNPIGMKTNLSFVGNGELDGGQTFSVTIAHNDKAAWSSSNITLNTNSMGTFKLSSAEGGGGIGGYDDNMPRAWEEVWDTGTSGLNLNLQKGVGSSTNISWTSPKAFGSSIQLAYAPQNDGVQTTDKSVSGDAGDDGSKGRGYDAVIDINPDWDVAGFNLFIGGSITEKALERGTTLENYSGDHEEAVVGLKISLGPMEVGGQISGERLRAVQYGKVDYYGNTSWGVSFNVNDDLSFSYGEARSIQAKTKHESGEARVAAIAGLQYLKSDSDYIPKSRMKGESWQVAYTIGGVALKYADTQWDNSGYNYDKKNAVSNRTLAVSMAF